MSKKASAGQGQVAVDAGVGADDEALRVAGAALGELARAGVDVGDLPVAGSADPERDLAAVVIYRYGGVPIGDVVVGPESVVRVLADAGNVDPHPDAVQAAVQRGAERHQVGV